MIDVKPTRSELLQLKKKIALAKSGYRLLKKKRDGLIVEFFKMLERGKELLKEIESVYAEAREKLILAELTEGAKKLRAISLALPEIEGVEVKRKNLMGVSVCEFVLHEPEKEDVIKSLIGVNIRVEEAVVAYRKLVKKFIKYAEAINALYRLLEEIEKTKRKVNALEFKVIPELEEKMKFIAQRLEEMERENIFRLKRMKGKSA